MLFNADAADLSRHDGNVGGGESLEHVTLTGTKIDKRGTFPLGTRMDIAPCLSPLFTSLIAHPPFHVPIFTSFLGRPLFTSPFSSLIFHALLFMSIFSLPTFHVSCYTSFFSGPSFPCPIFTSHFSRPSAYFPLFHAPFHVFLFMISISCHFSCPLCTLILSG